MSLIVDQSIGNSYSYQNVNEKKRFIANCSTLQLKQVPALHRYTLQQHHFYPNNSVSAHEDGKDEA